MSDFAWVTLATNDSYSLGALVLAHSLRKSETCHQIVVMITEGVSDAMKEKLRSVFNLVHEVNILNSKDEANLLLLQRPELGITFTKLHCWRLTQFKKCVFLDADTLVLKNCDELFERDEFSAAPDVGWPDCFNSGVFVYQPSETTYSSLLKFATEKGSFDGGDQGLLNLYFSDWAHKDIRKHLPFIYNMCSVASYSYLPALKQYGADTKIIHFIGATKPWQQYYNTETSQVSVVPGLNHLRGVIQLWWSLFYSHVHSTLSPARTESPLFVLPSHTISSFQIEQNQQFTQHSEPPHFETISVVDLWDNYIPESNNTHLDIETKSNHESQHVNSESHYFVETSQAVEPNFVFSQQTYEEHNLVYDKVVETYSNDDACVESCTPFSQDACSTLAQQVENLQETSEHHPTFLDKPLVNSSYSQDERSLDVFPIPTNLNLAEGPYLSNNPCQSAIANVICDRDGTDDAIVTNIITNELPTLTIKTPADTVCEPVTDKCDELAGALTCPFESQFRRQGWESGQVDYLGTDSFDNVWKKICETLGSTSLESKDETKQ